MAPSLFCQPGLDDRVADCLLECPVHLQDLTKAFGPDLTWRRLIHIDRQDLLDLPGWGPGTEEKLRAFIDRNIPYTFEDFLKD